MAHQWNQHSRGAESVAWSSACLAGLKPWVTFPTFINRVRWDHIYKLCTQEVKTGDYEVQGHP